METKLQNIFEEGEAPSLQGVKIGNASTLVVVGSKIKTVAESDECVTVYSNNEDEYEKIVKSNVFLAAKHVIFVAHGDDGNMFGAGKKIHINDAVELAKKRREKNPDDAIITSISACRIGSGILSKGDSSVTNDIASHMIKNSMLVVIGGKYDTIDAVADNVVRFISTKSDPLNVANQLVKLPQTSKVAIRKSADVKWYKFHDLKFGKDGDNKNKELSIEEILNHISNQMMEFKIIYDMVDEIDEKIRDAISNPNDEYIAYRDQAKLEMERGAVAHAYNYAYLGLLMSVGEDKLKYVQTYQKFLLDNFDKFKEEKLDKSLEVGLTRCCMTAISQKRHEISNEMIGRILSCEPRLINLESQSRGEKYSSIFSNLSFCMLGSAGDFNHEHLSRYISAMDQIIKSDGLYISGGGFDSELLLDIYKNVVDSKKNDHSKTDFERTCQRLLKITKSTFFKKMQPILAKSESELTEDDRKIMQSINPHNLTLRDASGDNLLDIAISFGNASATEDFCKKRAEVKKDEDGSIFSTLEKIVNSKNLDVFTAFMNNQTSVSKNDAVSQLFEHGVISGFIITASSSDLASKDSESIEKAKNFLTGVAKYLVTNSSNEAVEKIKNETSKMLSEYEIDSKDPSSSLLLKYRDHFKSEILEAVKNKSELSRSAVSNPSASKANGNNKENENGGGDGCGLQ